MQLSILIPTHERPHILRKCLDCISAQTILHSARRRGATDDWHAPLEVIIVSDGPDEKTAEMMQGLTWPFPIQYFAIPKSQQGVCRNRAVAKANAKLVLLIGDDMLLATDACERHLKIHEKNETGVVLGFTTWDPSLKITPLMKWMEKSGVQFGYPQIEKFARTTIPREIQHWFTYTSNVSLPASLLKQIPFREDVALYGWEDIEWGKRLADAGVQLRYEPAAKVYHHHLFNREEVWERSRLLGASAVRMERLVPELSLVPRGWKKVVYSILAWTPTNRGRHCRAFLKGVHAF